MAKQVSEGSLHKWFKGSKSKDGKGGWVNVVTGGTCASDEPGEGTPKCVSSAKRASMTKAERLSAARRKKKADPNQQSKSGAAKPTYVSTDSPRKKKKKKMNEGWSDKYKQSIDCDNPKGFSQKAHCQGKKKMKETYQRSLTPLTEKAKKCWPGYEKKGTKKMFGKTYNNCVKKEEVEYIDERNKGDEKFIEGETGSKRARRDMTSAMNRSGMGYGKLGREQQERRERHKEDRGKKTKGTKEGHSGSAYPQRSHTMDTMYPHKKKARLERKVKEKKSVPESNEKLNLTDTINSILSERLGGRGVSKKAAAGSIYPGEKGDGQTEDQDRGAGNKARRRSGKEVEKKSPTYLAYVKNKKKVDEATITPDKFVNSVGNRTRVLADRQRNMNNINTNVNPNTNTNTNLTKTDSEVTDPVNDIGGANTVSGNLQPKKIQTNTTSMLTNRNASIKKMMNNPINASYELEGKELSEVKDKKGKGSGKKDACYHKVKSRYSVWPSAYASGALVKCRKVGAANWGNSSKKESFSDWKSEFIWEDGDSSKKINEVLGGKPGDGYIGHPNLNIKNPFAKKQINKPLPNFDNPGINVNKVGNNLGNIRNKKNEIIKDTLGNQNNSYEPDGEIVEGHYGKAVNKIPKELDKAVALHKSQAKRLRDSDEFKKDAGKSANKIPGQLDKAVAMHTKQAKQLRSAGVGEKNCGCGKTPCKTYGKKKEVNETLDRRGQGSGYKMTDNEFRELEALKTRNFATGGKLIKNKQQNQELTDKYMLELSRRSQNVGPGEYKVDRGGKGRIPVTKSSVNTNFPNLKDHYDWRAELDEDWQKTNRQDKTDGMSQKAVNAYKRENPGSKLKTAVTKKPSSLKRGSKDAKRRKSFCSRMKGMKKRLTSAKTARDPDSRINKALRRWNC